MNGPLVLVTVPSLATSGMNRLSDAGAEVLFVGTDNPEADLRRIIQTHPIEGIISRTLPLDGQAIRACPTLRAISRHGVGYDSVDILAASECGIPVAVADGTNAQSVAELAIGLMFSVARKIPWGDAAIRKGDWPRSSEGLQLAGKVLGLVGYGRIAQLTENIARAVGMHVQVFDPFSKIPAGVETESLEELLRTSDVVSLHCPLTPETTNMIGAKQLAAMGPQSIIINTARGGLIDEFALATAIKEGRIGGAGLDTLSQEPPTAENPLLSIPQVVLCPHVGGTTDAALSATAWQAADNLLSMLAGSELGRGAVINRSLLKERQAR